MAPEPFTRANAPIAELIPFAIDANAEAAWRALAKRAEPNAFADPTFLLPALRRLANTRVRLALVWTDSRRAQLIGVAALEAPRLGVGLARVWRSEQAALAALMVDPEAAGPALDALVSVWPRTAGLVLPLVEPESALGRAARTLGGVQVVAPFRRAALVPGSELGNAKRRKEWGRLTRRLGERGRLETRVGAEPEAIERFLELEARGWKGARGTALAADPERAAFASEMLSGFAREGRLSLHELTLDAKAVAAGVELRAGRRAFFWKIAYDEAHASFSPGVLLARSLAAELARARDVDLADSCAEPDHPMLDHVWPDRLQLVDLALPRRPSRYFAAALFADRARREARRRLKDAVLPLERRKRP